MTAEQKGREAFEQAMAKRMFKDRVCASWNAKWADGEYVICEVQYAWEGWQAALSHASATAEECSVVGDAARLDALQEWITSGLRIEFAKSIFGNGVEIGLRFPCVAKVANTIRDAIDQAIAVKRGDGND